MWQALSIGDDGSFPKATLLEFVGEVVDALQESVELVAILEPVAVDGTTSRVFSVTSGIGGDVLATVVASVVPAGEGLGTGTRILGVPPEAVTAQSLSAAAAVRKGFPEVDMPAAVDAPIIGPGASVNSPVSFIAERGKAEGLVLVGEWLDERNYPDFDCKPENQRQTFGEA